MSLSLLTVEDRLEPLLADGSLIKIFSGLALAERDARPNDHEMPAAYLLQGGDSAQPSPTVAGRHRQRVSQLIGVTLALKSKTGRYEAADSAAVDALLDRLRGRLVGWQPEQQLDPLDFVAGRPLALRDRIFWWGETYRTAYQATAGS